MLTRIDSEIALNLDAVASIRFSRNGPELTATVNFLSSQPAFSEMVSGEAAETLYGMLGGAQTSDGSAEKHEPVPFTVLPFQARFARTKAWYYLKGADDQSYILAFVNAKGSCSMRTFDAGTGRFLGKKYQAGNYENQFADFIRNAKELMVNSQPNLERDCKEYLPDAVFSYLKKRIESE